MMYFKNTETAPLYMSLSCFDSKGEETQVSIINGYKKYDDYELFDCQLSRLAIESTLSKALNDDIRTRYSHLEDFPFLPGNVYFMMALEASNASVSLDVDDAADKFASLSLISFP